MLASVGCAGTSKSHRSWCTVWKRQTTSPVERAQRHHRAAVVVEADGRRRSSPAPRCRWGGRRGRAPRPRTMGAQTFGVPSAQPRGERVLGRVLEARRRQVEGPAQRAAAHVVGAHHAARRVACAGCRRRRSRRSRGPRPRAGGEVTWYSPCPVDAPHTVGEIHAARRRRSPRRARPSRRRARSAARRWWR